MRNKKRTLSGAIFAGVMLAAMSAGFAAAQSQPPTPARGPVVSTSIPSQKEVAATQEEHLLRWLSKRLGRPLVAPNLSKFGYQLIGGRLLSANEGAAAQLMYEDSSGQRLTIYVQAEQGIETAFRYWQAGDASTFAWIDQGFGFAVTARAPREQLLPIAETVYHALLNDSGGARRDPKGQS